MHAVILNLYNSPGRFPVWRIVKVATLRLVVVEKTGALPAIRKVK